MIYLDYNATTPVDERVLAQMLPYFSTQYGNAASAHAFGYDANKAVEIARQNIAHSIGSEAQEIIFTSGATESINLAIKGVYELYATKGKHIITVATEHNAVLDTCKNLEGKGAEITYLPVDADGLIDLDLLKRAIKSTTILIAVMYANNETGVIQPIEAIGQIAHEAKVFFFCDATQAMGKLAIDVQKENIDMLCFSGHKIYAPKGIGGLYVRRKNPRIVLAEQINGGGHERGWRSGTLNVPAIIGMAKALELFSNTEQTQITHLRNHLEKNLLTITDTKRNGHAVQRMYNVCNISFDNITGKMLLGELSKQLAVSSGSACSAAAQTPSHVLKAMGVPEQLAKNAIRFSLGRMTTEADINFTIDFVTQSVKKIRRDL